MMNRLRVCLLLVAFTLVVAARAEDANALPRTITVDGITYSNVTWRTVTPAAISIIHSTGAATIPLEKLPPELQKRFRYDPEKAAEYRAAEQSAEAVRQETLRKRYAEEAEAQKQAGEAQAQQEAEAAATKQPAEAAAKKTAGDFGQSLGPVVTLKFAYASDIKALPDGTSTANIFDADSNREIFVKIPSAGLPYMRNATQTCPVSTTDSYYGESADAPQRNCYSVYGRSYTTDRHKGAEFDKTAYWLVGVNVSSDGLPSW